MHRSDQGGLVVTALAPNAHDFAILLSPGRLEVRIRGRAPRAVDLPPGLEPALTDVTYADGKLRIEIPRRAA